MKIVIFGVGQYYQKRKDKISSDIEIVAFLDNNFKIFGKIIDGIQVFPPHKIQQIFCDKIVLMSAKRIEMRKQLIKLEVPEEKIWSWEQLNSEMWHGVFRFHMGNIGLGERRGKILIISTELNYNGGTLAAVYAALALQKRGFAVVLAAQGGSSKFIDEMKDNGINIAICFGMPLLREEEIFFIKQFDMVIVNVLQMISCAYEINRIKPTIWWIHEPSEMYNNIVEQVSQYIDENKLNGLSIYAVSSIAQRNFNRYFPRCIPRILPYGIPDQMGAAIPEAKKRYLVFATIGAICPIKAQDIFIRAVQLLSDEDKKRIRCWIIGSVGTNGYSDKIVELISNDVTFKLWGELARNELQDLYKEIDVVVCSSTEDCLPIAVTEGMMFQKICIVSDHTGSADYIEDGISGFVIPEDNVIALKEKIEWIIANKEKKERIGKDARKIYERYFTMDVFGDNLEKIVQDTVMSWNLNREQFNNAMKK